MLYWLQERALQMLKKSNQKGFTIIEVLIVLAIAGLIMLIIFLAVPALNRNSRNNQRVSAASGYAAAASEWSNNHNGKSPTSSVDLEGVNANTTEGFYKFPAGITNGASSAQPAVTDVDKMVLVSPGKCDTDANGQGKTVKSSRGIAVQFAKETPNNGNSPQCVEG